MTRADPAIDDTIVYADATAADGEALDAMAVASWNETFARFLAPADLAAYLAQAHGPAGALCRDLADPAVRFHVACAADEGKRRAIVGYARLAPLRLPAPAPRAASMELRQIYVLRRWQGRGVADRLMRWATDTARAAGAPELYLGVFEENARALAFYRRHAFVAVGETVFRVGAQADRDIVMRLTL